MIEFQRQPALKPHLDIAPLIDIIFLLLLFFILTSVVAEPGIPVDLSASSSAEFQQETADIQISLLKNGDIGLNGAIITLNDLPAGLMALFHRAEQNIVTVHVDKDAPFDQFVAIIDAAKAVGVETLVIAAETPR